MARIPEDEIQRLKATVDLVALVRASGVELAPVGADLRGRCLFHEETTASLVVTPAKALWHCFGCNAGGDAIRWVELTQHVSFRHAVEILRGTNGTPVAPVDLPRGKRATPLNSALPVALDATDQQLLNQVIDYYSLTLKTTGEAQEYLTKRGLVSSEIVDRFRLGYANNTLTYRLPKKTWREGRDVRARLTSLGIIRETTGHEHLAGSLVIPILDEHGNVQGAYGRKVTAGLRAGTPLHLYLRGPHKGTFNVAALAASREIILAEALIDALTWWAYGFRNVTSAFGVNGFTDEMMAAFKRHRTERVLIAFDRDEAGDKAAEELAPRLADAGIDVYRILFPRGLDANDYARSVESPSDALGVLLRSAVFVTKDRRAHEGQGRNALGPGPAEGAPSAPTAVPTSEGASTPLDGDVGAAAAPASDGQHEGDSDPAMLHSRTGPAAPSPEPPVAVAQEQPHEEAADPVAVGADVAAAAAPDGQHGDADPGSVPLQNRGGLPVAEPVDVPSLVVKGDQADMVIGDRSYRVGGLTKNLSPNALRITLRVSRGDRVHVDVLELLSSRARELYVRQAALELAVEAETVKKDLGKLLLELEGVQQKRIETALEAKPKRAEIPEPEKQEAFAFLKDPRLLDRIASDFEKVGIVGEKVNALVGYLAVVSRKLADPLALLIQSNSAAGKSTLMDALIDFAPEEDVERYTAMTGQSLYYLADTSLKHRILAIAEVAGAEKAGYAIKCLQSEGRISIATTVKDPETGDLKTKRHEVEGPVTIMLTTTEAEIDEELQNRCVVLSVNEDRAQTKAIHEAQRRSQTLAGIVAREERHAVLHLHRNMQRLLRPVRVVNPWADRLTFLDAKLRTRRDHVKYLTLIQAITLLHQYQRPVRQMEHRGRMLPYIEATLSDIEAANRLAAEVLGRSLDELSPATRRLLVLLDDMVTARCRERKVDRQDFRFTRREVREHTGWAVTQARLHLERLVDLEYLLVHRGARGQSFAYELLYDGQGKDGKPFLVGLLDVKALRCAYDPELSGENGHLSGPDRAWIGPRSAGVGVPGNGSG